MKNSKKNRKYIHNRQTYTRLVQLTQMKCIFSINTLYIYMKIGKIKIKIIFDWSNHVNHCVF